MKETSRPLILASTSPYRRALLARLGLDFRIADPAVDEAPQGAEDPARLVTRLATAKAGAVAAIRRDGVVVGADQVAVLDGAVLGKPGNAARARHQLAAASGREVSFLTAVSVIAGRDGGARTHVDVTRVQFRNLSEREIERYVDKEQPFDCAGSFKVEGLGICLFERVVSKDPTALIGLPMIHLCRILRDLGFEVP